MPDAPPSSREAPQKAADATPRKAPHEASGDTLHEAAFVAALDGEAAPGVHDGAGGPAADRLRVYRNNVIVSLRDALAEIFPATARLMGERYFAAAAVAYAQAVKPASPILWRYGEGFAAYLATLPGLAPYPFVPEAAALEFARLEAYHAADAAPLVPAALAAVPADKVARLVLVAHPAARVVMLPAGGFGAYADNTPGAPAADGPAEAALVTRPALDVAITPLGTPAARFAAALIGGAPLGQAADATLDLPATLALLLSAGAFADHILA